MIEPVGIYISVPFCKAKCTFCNFSSGVFGEERMDRYVDHLCREIRGAHPTANARKASLPRIADTIYFGGGTPSLLSAEQFRRVFKALRGEFSVAADAEITLECAPGQLSNETLDQLLREGMNRISFGVQSFVDKETAAVGRLHTSHQCEEEIKRVGVAGIGDINVDLIAGLPYQTGRSWRHSVARAIASGAPHVSIYLFEVDDESRLGREVLARGARYGAAAAPGEDEAAELYQEACSTLEAHGIPQYEISNFAREGHRSRHNLKYWRREPYIGFGLDAHSMLASGENAIRFANTSDLDEYLDDVDAQTPFRVIGTGTDVVDEIDIIGHDQAFEESLFLGLRLNEGVDLSHLREQFGNCVIRDTMPSLLQAQDAGLLELNSNRVWLTVRGRLASNEVFSRLLIPSAA
jgi:oxygen-independent coproporphyrinogen-3 oxidase